METRDEFNQGKKIAIVEEKKVIKSKVKSELDLLSLWGTTQKIGTVKDELPPQDKLPRAVIDAVQEIFTVQIEFIANMKQMQLMINTLRAHVDDTGGINKKSQLEALDNYLSKLEELFSIYDKSLAHSLFINADGSGPSPEEVIKKLSEAFQGEPLKKYLQQFGELTDDLMVINQIELDNNPTLSENPAYQEAIVHYPTPEQLHPPAKKINVYTIMPMQNLTRIQLLTKALGKELDSFERKPHAYHTDQLTPEGKNSALQSLKQDAQTAVSSADEQAIIYNARVGAIDIAKSQFTSLEAKMKPEEKQAAILRKILAMNMNTSLQEKSHAAHAFPYYLKTVLPLMYDKSFELDAKGGLRITVPISDPTYKDIHFALGISMTNTKAVILDPAKFDAEALDVLYRTTQNPLWIVLKSTKPIDATFTASQKMHAYIDVAQAFHDKKIGDVDKYKGAYNVALTAVQIAREHPEANAKKAVSAVSAAFEPNRNSKAPNMGQWIANKTKSLEEVTHALTVASAPQHAPSSTPSTPQVPPVFVESAENTPVGSSVTEPVSPGDELRDIGSNEAPDEVRPEFEASLVEERTKELERIRGQSSVTSAKALKTAQHDNAQLRSQLERTTQQLAELTDKLRVVEEQNSVLVADTTQIDALRRELGQLREQASTAQHALHQAEQSLLSKGAEVASARNITEQHAGALKSARLATQTEKARADKLSSELTAERAGLTTVRSTLENIQSERAQLLQDIQAEQAKVQRLTAQHAEALERAHAETGAERTKATQSAEESRAAQDQIKELQELLAIAQRSVKVLESVHDENRRLKSEQASGTAAAHKLSDLEKQVSQLTEQLRVARSETSAATERLSELQAAQSKVAASPEPVSPNTETPELEEMRGQITELTQNLQEARAEAREVAEELAAAQAKLEASPQSAPSAIAANSSNVISVSATVSPADAAESARLRTTIGSRLHSVAASLTPADFNMLLGKVLNNDTPKEELQAMEKDLQSLSKLRESIIAVTNNLKGRSGFFSTAAKVKEIDSKFQSIPFAEKVQLITMSDAEMNEKQNDASPVGAFLKALNQNRLLVKKAETTSFKEFKGQLTHLKEQPPEPDAGMKINA